MITTSKIYQYLNQIFPFKYQEKWDQSGKNIYFNKQIKKILICLEVNEETLNKSITRNVDLIISHHPIFINSKEIKTSIKEKKIIDQLNKRKISFIALHTNYDNNLKGMNFRFLTKTNIFNNIKPLKIDDSLIMSADLIKNITTDKFAKYIKNKFNTSRVIFNNQYKNQPINKIALCCGSGFSVFWKLLDNPLNIDLFVTGDLKWHDWQLCKLYNINIIDIGHDIENIFVDDISEKISNNFKTIKIITDYSNIKFNIK